MADQRGAKFSVKWANSRQTEEEPKRPDPSWSRRPEPGATADNSDYSTGGFKGEGAV